MKSAFRNSYGDGHFWQWDTGQVLEVDVNAIEAFDEVHIEDRDGKESIVIPLGPEKTVAVPDRVLEREVIFHVWAYDTASKRTVFTDEFKVIARQGF